MNYKINQVSNDKMINVSINKIDDNKCVIQSVKFFFF